METEIHDFSMESWPECYLCGDAFSPRRLKLGYKTCLVCGDKKAQQQIQHKKKCTAPLYNKGSYQYVSTRSDAKEIGR